MMYSFKTIFSFTAIALLCVATAHLSAARRKSRLKVGDMAPEFALQGDNGKTYSLSDFGDQKVVLFFYPKDESFYCTQQVCSLAQGYSLLKKQAITLFGINHQPIEAHAEFKKKHELPFVLLSDPSSQTIRAYGAYSPLYTKRITVLIENGKIVKVLRKIDVNKHADQILKAFAIAGD